MRYASEEGGREEEEVEEGHDDEAELCRRKGCEQGRKVVVWKSRDAKSALAFNRLKGP